jgi:hypothetical protein
MYSQWIALAVAGVVAGVVVGTPTEHERKGVCERKSDPMLSLLIPLQQQRNKQSHPQPGSSVFCVQPEVCIVVVVVVVVAVLVLVVVVVVVVVVGMPRAHERVRRV